MSQGPRRDGAPDSGQRPVLTGRPRKASDSSEASTSTWARSPWRCGCRGTHRGLVYPVRSRCPRPRLAAPLENGPAGRPTDLGTRPRPGPSSLCRVQRPTGARPPDRPRRERRLTAGSAHVPQGPLSGNVAGQAGPPREVSRKPSSVKIPAQVRYAGHRQGGQLTASTGSSPAVTGRGAGAAGAGRAWCGRCRSW